MSARNNVAYCTSHDQHLTRWVCASQRITENIRIPIQTLRVGKIIASTVGIRPVESSPGRILIPVDGIVAIPIVFIPGKSVMIIGGRRTVADLLTIGMG
jgi:hypothetical protein